MKKPSRKRLIIGAIVLIAAFCLISVGKLVAYEAQAKMGLLRESVGHRVVVSDGLLDQPFDGTLVSVHYRLNDTVGFFDLEIRVRNEHGGEMVTGLSPWDLCRVSIVRQ